MRRHHGGWRRTAIVVVVWGVVGVVGGLAIVSFRAERYDSSARLLVGPIAGQRTTLDAAGLLSTTYADLLTSRLAVDRTSEVLDVELDPDDVSALSNPQSRVILLTISSEDPNVPAVAADTMARVLTELVAERDSPSVGFEDPGAVTVLDPASEPTESHRPTPLILLMSVAATVAGGVAVERSRRPRPLINDLQGVPAATAAVPIVVAGADLLSRPDSDRAWIELGRELTQLTPGGVDWRSIAFVPVDHDPVFVDAVIELAMASARTKHDVIVVDSDGAHPTLAGRVVDAPRQARGASRTKAGERAVRIVGSSPGAATMRLVVADRRAETSRAHVLELGRLMDAVPSDGMVTVLTPPITERRAVTLAAALADGVVILVREGLAPDRLNEAVGLLRQVSGVTPVVLVIDDAMPRRDLKLQCVREPKDGRR